MPTWADHKYHILLDILNDLLLAHISLDLLLATQLLLHMSALDLLRKHQYVFCALITNSELTYSASTDIILVLLKVAVCTVLSFAFLKQVFHSDHFEFDS